jgi:hypothetical protein
MPRDANGARVTTNLAEIKSLWTDQVTRPTLRLVLQGPKFGPNLPLGWGGRIRSRFSRVLSD